MRLTHRLLPLAVPLALAAACTRAVEISGRSGSPPTDPPSAGTPASRPGSTPAAPASTDASRRILALVNAERGRAGLAPLAASPALDRAARIQADQLASTGARSHDVPGAPYPTLTTRLAAVGYTFRDVGENLAWNYSDADAAVRGWLGSAPHRANILDARYTEVGTAVVTDGRGRRIFVQVFARPR